MAEYVLRWSCKQTSVWNSTATVEVFVIFLCPNRKFRTSSHNRFLPNHNHLKFPSHLTQNLYISNSSAPSTDRTRSTIKSWHLRSPYRSQSVYSSASRWSPLQRLRGYSTFYQALNMTIRTIAARSKGVGLRPLACWDCEFESYRGHGYISLERVECCKRSCDWSILRPEKHYRDIECVFVCMCVCVIECNHIQWVEPFNINGSQITLLHAVKYS
jgi:hypothetical protein